MLKQSYFPSPGDSPPVEWAVGDLLSHAVTRHADRVALKEPAAKYDEPARSWSYAQLHEEARKAAVALLWRFKPGDRVAVWAAARPEYIFLQLGAALAKVVLVTLNPANRDDELHYLLGQSESRGLFMDREYRGRENRPIIETLRPALKQLEHVFYFEDWAEFAIPVADSKLVLPTVQPGDPVLILYTSGTTGKPKGVVLSHRGVVNNARFGTARTEIEEGAVWLNALPMFHIGGSITMTLGCISTAGTQVMLAEFNPEIMLRSIAKDRVNITMAVPTMLAAMFEHPDFATTDFSSLKVMVTGGTVISPEVVMATQQKLGVDVGVIFGQTEAGGVMAETRRKDSIEHVCHSVGLPLPCYDMKIVHMESGTIQPVGEIGEICVRGPCTMLEYFKMPERTAETIDAEGFVHTGDLGRMDEQGYMQITGRLKDMIIRGGENIYPREIEDYLITHPDVAEAAVFGMPDSKWGEQVAVAVRLAPDVQLDAEKLREFLYSKIARHKVPIFWTAVKALPINASGKIQKFRLREEYASLSPDSPVSPGAESAHE